MRVAVLLSNLVENVIEADANWQPPEGRTRRDLGDNEPCGPGWTFNGAAFDPPAPLPPPTDLELLGATIIALALIALNEINNCRQGISEDRQWIVDFKAAVAGAGSLAALKTAVAALPSPSGLADRTQQQLLQAVRDKLNDGSIV